MAGTVEDGGSIARSLAVSSNCQATTLSVADFFSFSTSEEAVGTDAAGASAASRLVVIGRPAISFRGFHLNDRLQTHPRCVKFLPTQVCKTKHSTLGFRTRNNPDSVKTRQRIMSCFEFRILMIHGENGSILSQQQQWRSHQLVTEISQSARGLTMVHIRQSPSLSGAGLVAGPRIAARSSRAPAPNRQH